MRELFSPDPHALLFALLLEVADVPAWWRGYLVSRLIYPPLHPVAWIYRAAAAFARPGGLARGVAALLAAAAPALIGAVLFRAARGPEWWWTLAEGYLLKLSFSITHVTYGCMRGYAEGRPAEAVAQFVRRRLSGDPHLVHSACIETAAESLVDSFISPLFYYLLLGLPGAWLQRAVNTADGAVGFKHYGRAGLPSAAADTALNYMPARIAALLLLSQGVADPAALRQRNAVESVNARWPIAAAAAALGVSLEKQGHYKVGQGPPPTPIDVAKALALVHAAAALYAAPMALATYAAYYYIH
ncbi:MAG: cobalamin biosynthesis protein [Pyrobaculum sp.]